MCTYIYIYIYMYIASSCMLAAIGADAQNGFLAARSDARPTSIIISSCAHGPRASDSCLSCYCLL